MTETSPTVWLLPAALIAAIAVAFIALHPRRDPTGSRDEAWFLAINRHRWAWPIEIALRLTSHFGLLPTNGVLWAAAAIWLDRREGVIGGLGMLVAWGACRLVKSVTKRVRPHIAVTGARLIGLTPSGSSFPSSHAALATYSAIAGSVILDLGVHATLGLYVVAAVVGYVRVYLGAHYPRDVGVGALIGATVGAATALILGR